ncbi:hypothetical protein MB02_09000 [Croceicoccus estronivorus]|uniref:PAS domain-containing protein n=1 Tax=Croceicoccus estronivorus TaxID=1172626 RepID=UPI00082F02C6|nr:hypothetical protein [Croceicoccus estronivorus]OCC23942.1 hypothetical protein MB02_09000 [Croceicoccus estronivorus]
MDSLRGNFAEGIDFDTEAQEYESAEDDAGHEAPPASIGQDERRMQVRAYNHWAGLLDDRNFPGIEDLDPETLGDFGPYSVLLDFTSGMENPGIPFLGEQLARECGAEGEITQLSDVPARSLLSRITDHYMQILANQAPIGFEAEFVNQRGVTILYRGILLPFSTDNDTIDFILGVINWKELADSFTTDELLLEIDQALDDEPEEILPQVAKAPLTDWADGPAAEAIDSETEANGILDLANPIDEAEQEGTALPEPAFGAADTVDADDGFASLTDMLAPKGLRNEETGGERFAAFADQAVPEDDAAEEDEDGYFGSAYHPDQNAILPGEGNETDAFASLHRMPAAPLPILSEEDTFADGPEDHYAAIELAEPDEDDMGLGDWLASARALAESARSNEDRTRQALYAAIGRAYDFSLAASEAPDEFAELVAESGLTMQDRAPMTPVVKLVFGADYDKTRLTEYAAALSHGHRLGVERGKLGEFIISAKGGLKGVVAAERRLRREESGKHTDPKNAAHEKLARKLRAIEPQTFDAIDASGNEFALVMIRRLDTGEVAVVGEVPEDGSLLERAARKLVD